MIKFNTIILVFKVFYDLTLFVIVSYERLLKEGEKKEKKRIKIKGRKRK